jgi:hypothetical protein
MQALNDLNMRNYESPLQKTPTDTEHLIIWNDEERAAVLCLNTDCSHG